MIKSIIVSVSVDRMEYMCDVVSRFKHCSVSVVEGAETRHRSIYNAVKAIPHGVTFFCVIFLVYKSFVYITTYSTVRFLINLNIYLKNHICHHNVNLLYLCFAVKKKWRSLLFLVLLET